MSIEKTAATMRNVFLTDTDFLIDVANKLFRVPATYGMDQSYVDRLCDLAKRMRAEPLRPRKPTLVVTMEGGMIAAICSDDPDALDLAEVLTIDYDTDGADPDEVLDIPQEGGRTTGAIVHSLWVETCALDIEAISKLVAHRDDGDENDGEPVSKDFEL